MEADLFRTLVEEAALAPSVHNVQPARWRLSGDGIVVAADLSAGLPASDPAGRDAGLSCGAAAEATVLALSARGRGARIADLWPEDDRAAWPGHRLAARIVPGGAVAPDPAHALLARRFTHRGRFLPADAGGWSPADAVAVTDRAAIAALAGEQDEATLTVLRDPGQRDELLRWMRLSPRHPRLAFDGMGAEAMRMGRPAALAAGAVLGPLWPLVDRLGLGRALAGEAANTRSAAAIALFHRPGGESPVTSGRAFLRLWLDATARGWAGWPMAALTDDPARNAAVARRHGVPDGRRLILALRFGPPDAPPPPRARRPLAELIA